jgi:hypothetical protein
MVLALTHEWTKRLRTLPESGMGYQLVDVLLKNGGRLERALVWNGQDLQIPDQLSISADDIVEITRPT